MDGFSSVFNRSDNKIAQEIIDLSIILVNTGFQVLLKLQS